MLLSIFMCEIVNIECDLYFKQFAAPILQTEISDCPELLSVQPTYPESCFVMSKNEDSHSKP